MKIILTKKRNNKKRIIKNDLEIILMSSTDGGKVQEDLIDGGKVQENEATNGLEKKN